jgi:hypothetical protein
MASSPVNVAQDLNNAIYSLASLNPRNVFAASLNDTWQAWYQSTVRSILPTPSWWLAFKGFWTAYGAARASAQTLSERTPPAEAIDPTLWKTLLSDVQEREALLGDASRATREAARTAIEDVGDRLASEIKDAARPAIFVSVVIGIALLVSSMRGRR